MSTKFRINIQTGEIEVEGSEQFVDKQINNLNRVINTIQTPPQKVVAPEAKGADVDKKPARKRGRPPKAKTIDTRKNEDDSYNEWIGSFRTKLKQIDRILIAGMYAQNKNDNKIFKTRQVSKLLKSQGIMLQNVTTRIYGLLKSEKVKITEKQGRTSIYKVTPKGEAYLARLMTH